jgi:hypothetical protein
LGDLGKPDQRPAKPLFFKVLSGDPDVTVQRMATASVTTVVTALYMRSTEEEMNSKFAQSACD